MHKKDLALVVPDLADIPEDDNAEPLDADVTHTATQDEVMAVESEDR